MPNEKKLSHQEHKEVTSILANERTYAAWIRTGLTALVTGIGAATFLPDVLPLMSVRILSVILTLFSVLCFFLAAWRYRHVGIKLAETNVYGAPILLLVMFSGLLIIVALLAAYGLWSHA